MSSLERLQEAVLDAAERDQPVRIVGGNSKSFLGYGPGPKEKELDTGEYAGIIDYRPEELMLRVKAGTSLASVNALLAENRQMLGAEPPDFGGSTMGGVVATGISGSRRPYAGAVRDHVLGVGMILASGEYAEFGGQVMKNVAGYDIARLTCGAYGQLGVIADVSLKVLPAPEREATISMEIPAAEAQEALTRWQKAGVPISAASFEQGDLKVRLSGSDEAVSAAERIVEATGSESDSDFWSSTAELRRERLAGASDLWRLSTDATEPLDRHCVVADWGFAQRWYVDPATDPRTEYTGRGYWTRIRASDELLPVFEPLSGQMLSLHERLLDAFDPKRLFNPGRLYRQETA